MLNELIREKLDELEIHKWWDYGDFEEIRDKDVTTWEIEKTVGNYFIEKIKDQIELSDKWDSYESGQISGLKLAIEIIENGKTT